MIKKESYRHNLPHYQLPGQAYLVTWSLKDAIPSKAFKRYTQEFALLKNQMEFHKNQKSDKSIIDEIRKTYFSTRKKYIKVYDELLDTDCNPKINLCEPEKLIILKEALHFWGNKKLTNYAFSIMPNHIHWVFCLFEKDEFGKAVYLQDILHSVKRFSSNKINKLENRTGTLWQKESFDTTIRDEKHMYNAIIYTLNNPVSAGLASNWNNWDGTWCKPGCGDF